MPELPRPTAARLQRPSWRDVRLVVGVVLVLLAVTLGAVVVAAADDTTPVYAVTAGLVPGQVVTQQDVRRVDVRLGADLGAYVAADHDLGADVFALREVRSGELLPASALGTRAEVRVKPVTMPVDGSSVRTLVTGSIVDVWVNARDARSTTERYGRPLSAWAVRACAPPRFPRAALRAPQRTPRPLAPADLDAIMVHGAAARAGIHRGRLPHPSQAN